MLQGGGGTGIPAGRLKTSTETIWRVQASILMYPHPRRLAGALGQGMARLRAPFPPCGDAPERSGGPEEDIA
jgi:hypothetical protein